MDQCLTIMSETDRQREKVYNPWHFRDRVTPDRTYCGRVVYERPKHYFSLADIERISRKIQQTDAIKPDKLERLFRAIWALAAPAIHPYYKDHFNTIFEYLFWVFKNVGEILSDPIGTLRRRTIELIQALADLIGVKVTFF